MLHGEGTLLDKGFMKLYKENYYSFLKKMEEERDRLIVNNEPIK